MRAPKKQKAKEESEFAKWVRTRKPKQQVIEAGDRERDGLVMWADLTLKEQRLFEDAYLSMDAVARRKQHLKAKSGLPNIDWVNHLWGLWRGMDVIRSQEEENAAESIIEEMKLIRGEHLRNVAHRLILAIEWGDWDSIRDLADTGRKVCPEGTGKRLEPPVSVTDAFDSLGDSGDLKSLILDSLFDLMGGGDVLILSDGGVYPPFDPNDSPSKAILKHRPSFRDGLKPKMLPTKMRLQNEVEERWEQNPKDIGPHFSECLKELGLNMLPKRKGGWNRGETIDKQKLNKKGRELRDSLGL